MSKETDWSQSFHDDDGTEAIRERVLMDADYIHARDKIDNTPLLSAIGLDEVELVQLLLEKGADPNCEVDDGYTCLLVAIESESPPSLQIIKALIAAGADLHVYGINGWAPLHMAAARDQFEAAKLLLDAGANVNQRIQIDGHDSPLMEATRNGNADMVRLLLEHGADTDVHDMILDQGLIELAETAMKGADPDTIEELRKLPAINPADLLADMDLDAEELAQMMEQIGEVDMVQNYIDGANELAENGEHAKVIEILRSWKK
jgi:ankyrin repeat protein